MNTRSIRVLVVDDSAVIREMICDAIEETPGVEVAGTAGDGKEALLCIEHDRPDVITLDIQMPGMDGLETLDAILQRNPIPVIMVSSLAQRSADLTLEALQRGALDYVAKPENVKAVHRTLHDELLPKIRTIAGADVQRVLQIRAARDQRVAASRRQRRSAAEPLDERAADFADSCVAVGISTGGPPALTGLLEALRPPLPPIVIVQHMPGQFTGPFAQRLNSGSDLTVKEAATGDVLKPNHVFIAKGGEHLHLKRRVNQVKILIRGGANVSGHMPSVDVMMRCAAEIFGKRCLGVIMTGMGRDGADGCADIQANGGYVLGQDKVTSDVYGMNKVAFEEGHVDRQFSLRKLPAVLASSVERLSGMALS